MQAVTDCIAKLPTDAKVMRLAHALATAVTSWRMPEDGAAIGDDVKASLVNLSGIFAGLRLRYPGLALQLAVDPLLLRDGELTLNQIGGRLSGLHGSPPAASRMPASSSSSYAETVSSSSLSSMPLSALPPLPPLASIRPLSPIPSSSSSSSSASASVAAEDNIADQLDLDADLPLLGSAEDEENTELRWDEPSDLQPYFHADVGGIPLSQRFLD
jgi:hypothetical protein